MKLQRMLIDPKILQLNSETPLQETAMSPSPLKVNTYFFLRVVKVIAFTKNCIKFFASRHPLHGNKSNGVISRIRLVYNPSLIRRMSSDKVSGATKSAGTACSLR